MFLDNMDNSVQVIGKLDELIGVIQFSCASWLSMP